MKSIKASIYSIDYTIKKEGKYRDFLDYKSWDVVLNTKGRKKVRISLKGQELEKFKSLNLDIDDLIRIYGDIDLSQKNLEIDSEKDFEIDILERAS